MPPSQELGRSVRKDQGRSEQRRKSRLNPGRAERPLYRIHFLGCGGRAARAHVRLEPQQPCAQAAEKYLQASRGAVPIAAQARPALNLVHKMTPRLAVPRPSGEST